MRLWNRQIRWLLSLLVAAATMLVPPSAQAATPADLLNNPHVVLSANAKADLRDGVVDRRVVDVLTRISATHRISVGTIKRGHPGGRASHHFYGRGADITHVDGQIVRPDSSAARQLVDELRNLAGTLKPDELGQPFLVAGDCAGGTYCFTKKHHDHIHVGYETRVRPPAASDTPPAADPARAFVAGPITADGQGYAVYGITRPDTAEGYHFGTVRSQPNPQNLPGPLADVAVTADGRGIAAVTTSCHTYHWGTARAHPNPPTVPGDRCVAVALTVDGKGRHVLTAEGRGYSDNTAAFPNPVGFTGQIVAMDITADGRGRAALSSSGQTYHDGTMTAFPNPPAVPGAVFTGIAVTDRGDGRVATDADGRLYADGRVQAVPANPSGFTGGIVDVDTTGRGDGIMATSGTGQTYHWGTVVPRGNGDPGSAFAAQGPAQPVPTGRVLPAGLRLGPQGVDFLKRYEGFRGAPYNDQAGHCTVGYGHLIHTGPCRPADATGWGVLTQPRAAELLAQDAEGFARTVRDSAPGTPLAQHEFDALVSLAFNIGSGAFRSSSVARDLRAAPPAYASVPAHMALWDKVASGGRLVPSCGLRNRRAAEGHLFRTGQYNGGPVLCK